MILFLSVIEDTRTRNVLESVYTKYSRDMFQISYSILKNEHDAHDCVQDSIIKLAGYIDQVEDVESASAKNFYIFNLINVSCQLDYRILHTIMCIMFIFQNAIGNLKHIPGILGINRFQHISGSCIFND